jgi:hypothetical protein
MMARIGRCVVVGIILGLAVLVLVPGTATAACNLTYQGADAVPGPSGGDCAGGTPAAGSAALAGGAVLAAAGVAAIGLRRGNMTSIGRALGGIYHGNRAAARRYPPVRHRVSLPKAVRHQIYLRQPRAPNGEDFVCAVTGNPIPCLRRADGTARRWDATTGKELTAADPNFSGGVTHPDPRLITFGHKPGHEWRHAQIDALRHSRDRQQVKARQRDPDIYQVEVRHLAHGHEWDPSYVDYWRPPRR